MVAKVVNIGGRYPGHKSRLARYENEKRWLMAHQDLPNIIQLNESAQTARHGFLFVERAEGGSLEDFILKNRAISERMARGIFGQLLTTVKVS